MADTWQAVLDVEASLRHLEYNDPLSDVLRAVKSALIFRGCVEHNERDKRSLAVRTAAAYAAYEAGIYEGEKT